VRADTAAHFASANDSINADAVACEDTIGYCVSQGDAAAASDPVASVDTLCRTECAWPLVGSGCNACSWFDSTAGFARQPTCSERKSTYAG